MLFNLRRFSLLATISLAPALIGGGPGAGARRAELLAADSTLGVAAGADSRALASRAADDVVFLHGGLGVVRGRAALSAALDSLRAGPLRALRWHAVRADVSADGASGYTLGYGERWAAASDSALPVRYIAFWRRDEREGWRLAALTLARGIARAPRTAPAGCETPTGDAPLRASSALAPDASPVIAADRAFAARAAAAGPGTAFTEFIAADGVMLGGPNPMTCGGASIAAAFAGDEPGDLTWVPRLGGVSAAGDLGFTVGVARSRGAGGPGWSKYLTIWKRQPDGAWRFVADGGNAAPPDA